MVVDPSVLFARDPETRVREFLGRRSHDPRIDDVRRLLARLDLERKLALIDTLEAFDAIPNAPEWIYFAVSADLVGAIEIATGRLCEAQNAAAETISEVQDELRALTAAVAGAAASVEAGEGRVRAAAAKASAELAGAVAGTAECLGRSALEGFAQARRASEQRERRRSLVDRWFLGLALAFATVAFLGGLALGDRAFGGLDRSRAGATLAGKADAFYVQRQETVASLLAAARLRHLGQASAFLRSELRR
ncbi:MAG: hypothetical protein ACREM2_01240 [Vulcanimicrobiaceae bacterium]